MNSFLFLIFLGVIIWFWQDTLKARENAVMRAKRYCKEFDYQFLDDSVALISLKPGRDPNGNFTFFRKYHFEFSLDGYNRYNGTAWLIGQHLQSIQLEHPEGVIIEGKDTSKPEIH